MMHSLAEKYLRSAALPTLFCPGCGNGIVLGAFLRAIDQLGPVDQLALVGGIGCSGWIPVYINVDVLHGLHGRAIPFATGLKLTDPRRTVVVFSGDGDCLAIGGNHFIHACRRNLDLTVIMVNNELYGMTGGQVGPTTPAGARTRTSPYGNAETPFDACQLAIAAGATYVARWTTLHARQLVTAFQQAMLHPGLALVEVLTQCPTQAGRYLKKTTDAATLLREVGDRVSEKRLPHGPQLVCGTLHQVVRPEFAELVSRWGNREPGNRSG